MTISSYNCIVCAEEFSLLDLKKFASRINSSKFKICQTCLDRSDPSEDYKEAREIVNLYLKTNSAPSAKSFFSEAHNILKNIKIAKK